MNQNVIEEDNKKDIKQRQFLGTEKSKTPFAFSITSEQWDEKGEQQKSICQKYLNVYESINRKQKTNNRSRRSKKLLKGHRLSNDKNSNIFENSLIQNTCSSIHLHKISQKNLFSQNKPIAQKILQSRLNTSNSALKENFLHNPHKNDLSLQMLTDYKYCQQQKLKLSNQHLKVNGRQMLEEMKNKTIKYGIMKEKVEDKKSGFFENENFLKLSIQNNSLLQNSPHLHTNAKNLLVKHVSRSSWCKNIFHGNNTKTAYTGYFKAKTKKKFFIQRQKMNTVQSLGKVNKSLNQGNQRIKLKRPQSCLISKSRSDHNSFSGYGGQQSYSMTSSSSVLKAKSIQRSESSRGSKRVTYFGISTQNSKTKFLYNGLQKNGFQRKNSNHTFHFSKRSSKHRNNLSVDSKNDKENKENMKVVQVNDTKNRAKRLRKGNYRCGSKMKVSLNMIEQSAQNDVQMMIRQIIPK